MDAERYRRRIESHVAHGRLDAALAAAQVWAEREPALLEPELLRARIDLEAGRYRSARDRAVAAIGARDCPPTLALEAVDCLSLFVAHNELFDFAAGYAHWRDVPARDKARTAGTLSAIGASQLARELADAAVAAAPDDPTCRVNRAFIASYAGDFASAGADLEHTLATPHSPAVAHWLLARIARQTGAGNHVARLRRQLDTASDERYREYLQFALFKELDDLGETPAAWAALEAGCALARQRAPYDRLARERLFAALKRQFGGAEGGGAAASDAPTPIFIVGLHRSGTTLLESMLAAHPGVHAYGESQRLSGALRYAADHYCQALIDEALIERAPTLDAGLVGRMYSEQGRRVAGGARFLTEKTPGNFQLIGFIRQALPRARVVHLRRDPMDVCFANLRELFADAVDYSYAQEDLAHFHGLYEDLMQHWRDRYPGFVLDIDYEALVSDPRAALRRVADFCGLDWRPEAIDPAQWRTRSIHTLSSAQARRQISTASIGRWKPYAHWLEPLQEGLQRNAQGRRPV